MSDLLIVESPAKAQTIEKYLGKKYKVVSSKGHVRDLPKSTFGVDIENGFEPHYMTIRGKSDLIKSLKKEVKAANTVYLATDPDREGEAISWHLYELLGLNGKDSKRIVFNEITKNAVKEAVKNPRDIDMDLVAAQQARRILDRIVGYKLSPFLWKKVKKGLSAGRVQSVTTAMIVDRENEIRNFKSKEYWTLTALFQKEGTASKIPAKFYGTVKKAIEIENEQQANEIYKKTLHKQFNIDSVKLGQKRKSPAPPFTTSTLQQEASRRFNFQTKRTMKAAQELYEGVSIEHMGRTGLITYMRTDSLRISDDAANAAKEFIISNYGEEFYPEKRRVFKTKKGAQDAHEAIRPSNVALTPERVRSSLSQDQFRLYKLIYERFIASQMSEAIYNTQSADISDGNYLFKAYCQSLKFNGFTAIYQDADKEENDKTLYKLEQNEKLILADMERTQSFTQPPARYTEGTLTKALDENGIGRPSTFMPIISTILARDYVERDGKTLKPTYLGEVTTQLMKDYFSSIIDYDFSANLETDLDKVSDGEVKWNDFLEKFYEVFSDTLEKAEDAMKETRIKLPNIESDELCPVCGKNLVVRNGKFGKFLACPGYPECKFTKPIVIDTGVPCPKCGARILKRKTKTGKIFYGCDNYPKCDYMTWDEPLKTKCENCGSNLFRKSGKSRIIYCPNPECQKLAAAKKAEKDADKNTNTDDNTQA